MPQSTTSIAEFAALVEKLRGLLPGVRPELDAQAHLAGDPLSGDLAGQDLRQSLQDCWPIIGIWSGPLVSEQALARLHQERRQLQEELAGQVEELEAQFKAATARLRAAGRQAAAREEAAAQAWSATLAAVPQLQAAGLEMAARLKARRAEALRLGRWLGQVEPHGLNRYRHPQGRVFSQEFLKEASGRLEALWTQLKADQRAYQELKLSLQEARARRQRAAKDLDQAQAERRRFHELRQGKIKELQALRAQLDSRRGRLVQQRQAVLQALALRLLHGRLLAQCAPALRQALRPLPAEGQPLAALEQALAQAAGQARRAARLAGLAQRMERRLARQAEQAGKLGRQAREINKTLEAQEQELPRILAPLGDPGLAGPELWAQAAAQLSSLLPRLREALPGAREIQAAMEDLRSAMGRDLERGRALVESWREAAKAERASLAQAQALALEAQALSRARRGQAAQLAADLEPWLQPLAELRLAELAPSLTAVLGRRQGILLAAQTLEDQAQQLAAAIGQPSVASISRSPAALKPHATAQRRLAQRRVEVERLSSLIQSVAVWQERLDEPLAQAIRQPMQEVASRLQGSLASLAAERQRLLQGRDRSARRLLDLRQRLSGQDQDLSRTRGQLSQLQQAYVRESQLNSRLGAQLAASQQARHEESQSAQAEIARLGQDLTLEREGLARTRDSLGQAQKAFSVESARVRQLEELLRAAQARWQDELAQTRQRLESELSQTQAQLEDERGQAQTQLEAERAQASQLLAGERAQARALLETTRSQAQAQLASERSQAQERMEGLSRQVERERELLDLARQHLRKAARRHARQSIRLRQLDAELALARQGQAAALDLVKRLESAGLDAQYLEERLAESQRLARALRAKSLERHQLLRQAQAALAPLEMWREEALRLEAESARLRGELEAAREQVRSAEQRLAAAHLARDQASARLVSEQTARAQQALDLLEGQTLAVELAAAQGEAARWAQLAQALSQALVVMGAGQAGEPGQMGQQVESLTREAEDLRRQLRDISLLVALHLGQDNSRPGGPVGLRLSFRQPQQGERLLGRLGEVRSRLAKLGKGALGHWGVIAALTAGLTFIAPNTPSKATLQEAPLLPPRQELKHLSQELTLGQRNLVPAQAARLRQNLGAAELEMNLLPLRKKNGPLPAAVQRQVEAKARTAGLQPAVLITSARAVLGDQEVVDVALLDQLADTARGLAQRHPLIFQELSQEGLPRAAQALTALAPAREQGQHLFQDRIYREYRSLGFSAEEALGALAANELAAKAMKDAWRLPGNYQGQVRPVAAVEAMGLSTFMSRVTPYIQSRVEFFLRHQGGAFTGDVAAYSKDLAYDIYCAAKKFDVPVSLMLVIANQETSYANVLGDSNRSASPFQIFEPTRRLIVNSLEKQNFVPPPREIRLEHHLTMATYMAAFHVRELMQESIVNPGNGLGSYIDTDRVMKRYNGSNAYAPQVAQRQKQLTSFLALYGG